MVKIAWKLDKDEEFLIRTARGMVAAEFESVLIAMVREMMVTVFECSLVTVAEEVREVGFV